MSEASNVMINGWDGTPISQLHLSALEYPKGVVTLP